MNELLGLCVAAGVASYYLVGSVRNHAIRTNMVDVPNSRSLHSSPIPRGAGLGIVVAFALAAFFAGPLGLASDQFAGPLLLGAIPIAWIGWRDDHGHVAPKWRAVIHVGASLFALMWLKSVYGYTLPQERSSLLTFPDNVVILAAGAIAAAYFLNVYNFMDGIDGLAGSQGAFIGLAALPVLKLAISAEQPAFDLGFPRFLWTSNIERLAPILGCCCLGFLLWNWPPARVFMGDVCSGFLGFVFAFFALASSWEIPRLAWVWLILFGVFLVDGTYTLVVRFVTGQKWHEAHRLHAFQKAALNRRGHKPVTLTVVAINVLWLFPLACLAAAKPAIAPWATLVALAPLVALASFYKAGRLVTSAPEASTVAK